MPKRASRRRTEVRGGVAATPLKATDRLITTKAPIR